MTRSEAYAEGFHRGRLHAERDIQNHERGEPMRFSAPEPGRSMDLGYARGYRDTWARWDAGTLTASMLEHAPLRAGR